MVYILSIVTSVVSAMLVFILQSTIKENRKLRDDQGQNLAVREEALENGVVCLLRVKLIEYHAKYAEAGSISSHGLDNWKLMYKAYKDLGGNGMITHLEEEIEKLHVKN